MILGALCDTIDRASFHSLVPVEVKQTSGNFELSGRWIGFMATSVRAAGPERELKRRLGG